MARKKATRFPWGDDPRDAPSIGLPKPEKVVPPRPPTPEERAYTEWLIGEITARIVAESDPVVYGTDLATREGTAVAAIRAVLRKLVSPYSVARVLREVARLESEGRGES